MRKLVGKRSGGYLAVSLTIALQSMAFGADTLNDSVKVNAASTSENSRKVGQFSYLELDGHAGAFSGLRLKAIPLSGESYNLAIEGFTGSSVFADSALFAQTYGIGARGEFYLSSVGKHAWMISPGLDGYYLPAHLVPASQSQSFGQAFGDSLNKALNEVPNRVTLVSTNVDINWLYQFYPHFGFVAGAKVGAAVTLNGTSSSGEDLAGRVVPDLALYIGTRF